MRPPEGQRFPVAVFGTAAALVASSLHTPADDGAGSTQTHAARRCTGKVADWTRETPSPESTETGHPDSPAEAPL